MIKQDRPKSVYSLIVDRIIKVHYGIDTKKYTDFTSQINAPITFKNQKAKTLKELCIYNTYDTTRLRDKQTVLKDYPCKDFEQTIIVAENLSKIILDKKPLGVIHYTQLITLQPNMAETDFHNIQVEMQLDDLVQYWEHNIQQLIPQPFNKLEKFALQRSAIQLQFHYVGFDKSNLEGLLGVKTTKEILTYKNRYPKYS